MTTKQQLAWCYLNAAIAACGAGSDVQIGSLWKRFCGLAGLYPTPVETFGRSRERMIGGMIEAAAWFAHECEKGESCPPAT